MEDWEEDFGWQYLRRKLKDQFKRDTLPDMNAILFLIGIQELGRIQAVFSKEEKQDLMHIAICKLLSSDGHYQFKGRDEDGWPQWETTKLVKAQGVKDQQQLLRTKIIEYFKNN